MFFDFIDKIRKKPKATKELITLIVSVCVTAVVAIIWLATYIPSAGSSLKNGSISNLIGPFKDLGDNLADIAPQTTIDGNSQMASPGESDILGVGTSTASSTDVSSSTPTRDTMTFEEHVKALMAKDSTSTLPQP